MNMPGLTGLAVGAAYGYVAQRGAFCMNSGFRVVVTNRDLTKVKAYGAAIAVQMLILPVIFAAGLSSPSFPAFVPAGAILGGLLFGASMNYAGACAAGVWYKTGSGNLGSVIGVAGMALGAATLEVGPLRLLREAVQAVGAGAGGFHPATWLGLPLWQLMVPAGVLLILLLARAGGGSAGAWSWRRTGLLMGIVGAAAWPLSSLSGRHFGMGVISGTVAMVSGVAGAGVATPWWDLVFVIGIPAGAYLAARRDGPVRLAAPTADETVRRFTGGLGLGVGASLAGGCTVGHGLTGIPLLAPGSLLSTAAIFVGSSIVHLVKARRAKATTEATGGEGC